MQKLFLVLILIACVFPSSAQAAGEPPITWFGHVHQVTTYDWMGQGPRVVDRVDGGATMLMLARSTGMSSSPQSAICGVRLVAVWADWTYQNERGEAMAYYGFYDPPSQAWSAGFWHATPVGDATVYGAPQVLTCTRGQAGVLVNDVHYLIGLPTKQTFLAFVSH